MKHYMRICTLIAMSLCFAACGKESEDTNSTDEYNNQSGTGGNEGQGQKQTIGGYEYVDLGLSVKWASCNVEARTPIEAGGFYQYGNPESYSFVSDYQLPSYDIGGTAADPAYVNMGEKWRMPTRAEMTELVNGCEWVVTMSSDGTRYYVGTSRSNGQKICLPAAGAYPLGSSNSSILYENEQCWLLTSSLDGSGNPRPYILKIQYLTDSNNSIDVTTNEVGRYSAMPVRGVSTADDDHAGNHTEPSEPGSGQIKLFGMWKYVIDADKDGIITSILSFKEDGTGWEYVESDGSDNRRPNEKPHPWMYWNFFTYAYDEETGALQLTMEGEDVEDYTVSLSSDSESIIIDLDDDIEMEPYTGAVPDMISTSLSMPKLSSVQGEKYVDLGLSVNWAFEDVGGFFQYGNLAWGNVDGGSHGWTTDDYALPTYDIGGSDLDPATHFMGSKWRMPTRAEAQELVDKCTWTTGTTLFNHIRYFKVVGPSGNAIFLFASGAFPLGLSNESLLYENFQCWLLTSTLDGGGNPRPYILKASYVTSSSPLRIVVTTDEAYRISGIPVRGVTAARY
ncbi:MAG: hypothetical protein IJ767_03025 [Bacteroidaceae bacterium]|nr:hypothetical protein [Bacteroidaceae bacterium]